MENQIKSAPRDVFLYLLTTATLYAGVVAFITLLFAYVDVSFPDPLNFCYVCLLEQIRWSSSALLVVFPVFIFLFGFLRKEYALAPERREIKVRKWLVYLTLFLTSVTIIVDLVVLISNFYGGELTARFFLKTLAVLAVAAAVFWYYVWDIKKDRIEPGKTKAIAWVTSLLVLAALVGGFFVVGSPAVQRDRRFDERRVNDLMTIQGQVINFWQQKGKLPTRLADLKDDISGFAPPVDPQTREPYGYVVKGLLKFEICAAFKTEGRLGHLDFDGVRIPKPMPMPVGDSYTLDPSRQNWDHGIGRVCFDRAIDPDLYKFEKPRSL